MIRSHEYNSTPADDARALRDLAGAVPLPDEETEMLWRVSDRLGDITATDDEGTTLSAVEWMDEAEHWRDEAQRFEREADGLDERARLWEDWADDAPGEDSSVADWVEWYSARPV